MTDQRKYTRRVLAQDVEEDRRILADRRRFDDSIPHPGSELPMPRRFPNAKSDPYGFILQAESYIGDLTAVFRKAADDCGRHA